MPDWKEIKEALLVVYHRWLTRAPPYGKCGCSSVIHVSFCTPPWKKITVNYSTMPMPHHRDVLNICNRNSKPSVRKQLQLIKKLRKKENEDKANLQSIYAIDHDIGTRGCFFPFNPGCHSGSLAGLYEEPRVAEYWVYFYMHIFQHYQTYYCIFYNLFRFFELMIIRQTHCLPM